MSGADAQLGLAFLGILIVLTIYVLIGSVFEHFHFHLIHETGVGILIGMLVGFIFYYSAPEFYEHLNFNGEFFFYVILPPIIFAGGYNLQQRKFFQNFSYISLYGIFGTLINFGIVLGLLTAMNNLDWIRRYSDRDTIINLSITELMLFSATICATDSVAALAMIKSDKYPKLFSVIFGEGMVNDSVSIILYKSVFQLIVEGNNGFEWYTTFLLIWQFLLNSFTSVLIGCAYGALACIITGKMHFISQSPTIETCIVFLFGYMAYISTEILSFSGVISILVCGIFMSHYLWYNLSINGRISTGITFQFLAVIAEASLYMYLGLSFWHIVHDYWWSWTFVVGGIIICIIARFCGVFVLSWIAILIKKRRNWRLNRYEMWIIWFSGIIRGAIAFALIQTLPSSEQTQRSSQVVQSTVLFIVMLTTIILGALMPKFIEFNMNMIQNTQKYNEDHPSMRDSLRIKPDIEKNNEKPDDRDQVIPAKKPFFKMVDEQFLKPLLIYDYNNRKEQIKKDKEKLQFNGQEFNKHEISEVEIKSVNPLYSSLIANKVESNPQSSNGLNSINNNSHNEGDEQNL